MYIVDLVKKPFLPSGKCSHIICDNVSNKPWWEIRLVLPNHKLSGYEAVDSYCFDWIDKKHASYFNLYYKK